MEISRRRLLRDSIGAGAALTLGAAAGGLRIPQAAHAAAANDGHALGFRSLTDEISLPDIPVEGRIPPWLEGVLLRNGPGLFEIGEQKLNHWFDGLAMLHAFAFAGGRVSYANRFLQSSAYKAYRREGVMKYSEFGTDPCRQIFSGVSTIPVIGKIPNANVSIEHLAGQFRAHTELPVPVNFDPHSLRTLGVEVDLPQGRMGTAHPHHDPRTRERFSYEIELVRPRACGCCPSATASAASWPSSPTTGPATSTPSASPTAGSSSRPALGVRPRHLPRPGRWPDRQVVQVG